MKRLVFFLAVLSAFLATVGQSREGVMVLLFDDGRVSHYQHAYPILEQYGLKGTFGIITGKIDMDPYFLTRNQVIEMAAAGHEVHDHTLHHIPSFWGDVSNAPAWRDTIQRSLDIFASMGLTTRGWNQPGGTGQGWSQALRDTLALFYDYAAGRVTLEWYQNRNFHWHLLDDPLSLGRGGVFSWGYNQGTSQKQELENILTKVSVGLAQGLTVIPAFHNVLEAGTNAWVPDDSTAWAVAQICSFAVANDVTVLTMEDAVHRASNSHHFIDKWGEQITNYGFLDDINGDSRPDGWELTTYASEAAGSASRGLLPSRVVSLAYNAGTYVYGPEKGTATLKFMARGDVLSNMEVRLYKIEVDYSCTTDVYKTTIDYQWADYSFTFEIPENTDRLQIRFAGFSKMYLAHVSLKLTGTPVWTPGGSTAPRLKLWPNPATDVIHALLPKGTETVRVYDVKGRLAGEFGGTVGRAMWDVRDWPSGIYFASALLKNNVIGKNKFVVIR